MPRVARQLRAKAGDVVIYLGGSLLHGVIGWRDPSGGGRERRAVLAKAFPRLHPYPGDAGTIHRVCPNFGPHLRLNLKHLSKPVTCR